MSLGLSKRNRLIIGILPAVLVLTAASLIAYKVGVLGYDLEQVAPTESYFVETVIEFTGHGSPVEIKLVLPPNLPTQAIRDESYISKDMKFSIDVDNGNRFGVWQGDNITGKHQIGFSATVVTESRRFLIDSTLPTIQTLPAKFGRYLMADSVTQSDNPEIVALADRLGLNPESSILRNIRLMFHYVTDSMAYVQYSGTTDALTACRLNEASCGGKSRLMVALARHLGIPGRLVGGKIMKSGRSTATHIWLELYVGGQWVPFCPTNNYFAELPSHYMTLYHGEESAITHTKDINFKYFFNLRKRLVSAATLADHATEGHDDAFNIWGVYKRAAISLELLRIIMMLPLGVLVVVIYRNLIGIPTFGTFMPALLAIGFRDTGLGNGLILFVAILTVGIIVRAILEGFHLLHTPRLAIVLSSVITFMLTSTALSVSFGFLSMARVALFPMVILTMTVERFSLITDEDGLPQAIVVALSTMLVASSAYLVMTQTTLQSIMLIFPEILLVTIAMYIYIGHYTGLRLVEFIRFRHLLWRPGE